MNNAYSGHSQYGSVQHNHMESNVSIIWKPILIMSFRVHVLVVPTSGILT